MKEAIEVVPFEIEQLEALQALAIRTFTHTYAAHNQPGHINEYIDQSFNLVALQADAGDPLNTYLIARYPGQEALLGYVKLSTGRTHESVGVASAIEIERIYVEPDAIGMGVGAALMNACLSHAANGGHEYIWLGVWENNAKAVGFYERCGFTICGEQIFNMGSDEQRDFVMSKPIS